MKVKNILILAVVMLISVAGFAQKGSVTKASSYLTKEDYASAKAEIDVAITIEKNAAKSKTWFTRGQIYEAITKSEDEAVTSLDPESLQKAVAAYQKVMEMEKEASTSYILSNQNIESLWGLFVNKGGDLYGEEKFEGAMNQFEKALLVKPTDSLTLLYAGVSSQQAELLDKTLDFYYQMVELNVASSDVYSTLIYLERSYKKNDEQALALVLKVKEIYPEDKKFGAEEISLLLALDKMDEAKGKLEAAITEDPTNVNYHLNLGVLYDNLAGAKAKEDKMEEARAAYATAQASYKKAIEYDPENFIGNFNTGVIYVNLAKEFFDQARDMDYKTYQKKGKPLEEKGSQILKDAIPYLEKANEVQANDIDVLSALSQVYTILKMFDKAEVVMNQLDALEGGE